MRADPFRLETIEALQGDADEIVCLATPPGFYAVGQFYRDFHQVSDDEMTAILREKRSVESHTAA